MTVDCEKGGNPTENLPDETILHLLEEHKALPTDRIASEIEASMSTIRNRLQKMAKVGLIERRETVKGDVWLIW
ncbi:DeoR family transcriptional regulator [Halohasta salina]|uniref:DeoR family transcriptional regulator n=1 Tax=Halohasta salina TaxID=2961621 RepID=UPI0020A2406F|nr:DeoR family transcriptional regulator [Halohasta salina]